MTGQGLGGSCGGREFTAEQVAARIGSHQPTAEQTRIIQAPLEPASVIAGAGSGKTETMAARVVWLVANQLLAPEQVLGLTFTRKAAAELAERIRIRLAAWRTAISSTGPVAPTGEPTVLTYAAYARQLVIDHAVRVGEEPHARLLSAAAAWQVGRDVVAAYRGPMPDGIGQPDTVTRRLMELAGRIGEHLLCPGDIAALDDQLDQLLLSLPSGRGGEFPNGSGRFRETVARRRALLPLVAEFAAAKRRVGGRDFGDEMVLAAQLGALPPVAAQERARFAAVLLDEYQDTGHAQVVMLSRLFGQAHPVMAVGDPLQSIYGWRSASTATMTGFSNTFRRADGSAAARFPLRTSWRNDIAVLAAADEIARPLPGNAQVGGLVARPGAGSGQVRIAVTPTVVDEAGWLARELRAAWDLLGGAAPRTAAVLVRKRSQIPMLQARLTDAGLPVEVMDLGGLLMVPEVADIYATLQVIADHTAGAALMRLLTGARWRIGVADLLALRRRAGRLATGPEPVGALPEPVALVEALDDLGEPDEYTDAGYRRLRAFSAELHQLRRRAGAPLPELVVDVEHTIGLDIEVAARADSAGRPDRGRVHLDRFLDEVTRFSAEADRATLPGFLAFLAAALQEENGLGAGEVVVEAERVQLLTVHGAKGLEWDIVAIPGLVSGVFPGGITDDDWTCNPAHLPDAVRGDAPFIPHFRADTVATRNEFGKAMGEYHSALGERRAEEERRLAYVAVTRARRYLLLSGYVWDHTRSARTVSPYLQQLRELADVPAAGPDGLSVTEWTTVEQVPDNPMVEHARAASWPVDPLGARRGDVVAGAALVRRALAGDPGSRLRWPAPGESGHRWGVDAQLLLAEQARAAAGHAVEVRLPDQLSVSALVALRRDPQAVARSLRRSLPVEPNPRARRGTAFHQWLEQRWQAQPLLDVGELPGAADDALAAADASRLAELITAFEASEWAARVPVEVEVPFDMVVGGRVIRGRMDAVFTQPATASSGLSVVDPAQLPEATASRSRRWMVVDWKTGAVPTGDAARAASIQLAVYRLAWAALRDVPVDQVEAAFHYVPANLTVRPSQLLDEAGLCRLIHGD